MGNERKFAILIDADNITDKYVKIILDETAKYGVATYKRIYGDWTNTQLNSWKNVLLDNSINPIQQYGYTVGKNATDSAMIIDAMDILYSGTVDGFCIASSDSDFTRLASRLRESGMYVIGMGEEKTPKPFVAACNLFRYLDKLYSYAQSAAKEGGTPEVAVVKNNLPAEQTKYRTETGAAGKKGRSEVQADLKKIKKAICDVVEECSDEDGWIYSGELGNQLAKRFPDFDVRNYGFSKFTPFMESLGMFKIRREPIDGQGNVQLVYYKNKG